MKIKHLIGAFTKHLRRSNYSEQSIKNYETGFKSFMGFYGVRGEVENIVPSIVDGYIIYLRKRGYATGTVRAYVNTLRVFFRWLYTHEYISHIPRNSLQLKMSQDERACEQRWLTDSDIIRIRQHVTRIGGSRQLQTRAREQLVVELLITTGARASEVASMHTGRVDIQNRNIEIYGGKTAETARNRGGTGWRNVPMKGMISSYMMEWGAVRQNKKDKYLFSETYCSRSIQVIVRSIAKDLDMIDNGKAWLTPHKFRHYFATDLSYKKVPIGEIAEIMGDNPLTVARSYIHRDGSSGFSEGVYL